MHTVTDEKMNRQKSRIPRLTNFIVYRFTVTSSAICALPASVAVDLLVDLHVDSVYPCDLSVIVFLHRTRV